jgi:hypothetical protein
MLTKLKDGVSKGFSNSLKNGLVSWTVEYSLAVCLKGKVRLNKELRNMSKVVSGGIIVSWTY